MTIHRRAAWAHRTVSALIAVGLLGALTMVAGSPDGEPLEAGAGDGPTITIDGATVDFSASGELQALGNGQGCILATNGAQVLVFGGGGKSVGFVDGSLGVKSKGNGQDCGQVDGNEALTIALGSAVTGGSTPYAIGTAVLDVEVLQDAAVTVTASFVDGNKVSPAGIFTLASGANASAGADNTPESTSAIPAASCNPQSSSGPNAADADNCHWTITSDVPFNRFVITETAGGKASLQGGDDWSSGSVGGPTVLHLVDAPDGILACGDTISTGGTDLGGVITRLGNAGMDPDCDLKPYQFQVSGDTVEFEPVGDAARYSAGITKTVTAGQPIGDGDWIRIDEDGDGTASTFEDMQWCRSATVTNSVTGGEVTRLVTSATLPAGEIWCVAAVDVGDPTPSGMATATFWLYGVDDPHWR